MKKLLKQPLLLALALASSHALTSAHFISRKCRELLFRSFLARVILSIKHAGSEAFACSGALAWINR